MAQLMTVRLSRSDNAPWGFRLQGGKDFGCPLVIQKVNGGSPAEKAGLIAGDSLIKVNNIDVFNLRHKDAQDVIIRAGPSFEVTIQRGGSTWKPQVTPTGNVPKPSAATANSISPVTKTSLAAKPQSFSPIGSSHNVAAKGFNSTPHLNGNAEAPKLVNKQYNSPMALYSEESIAETLSAQTEVLSTGALGVNFKKNEKTYNAANSEVLKMLQEAEKEPHSEPVAGLRHVTAPETKPVQHQPTQPHLPPGQNICADCERLIVGVFVRIKDKNLHVECFKCSTCGTSLKNVGYYNINHKLYCDIHAKLAAKSNPPGPNMVPVTIPPGGQVPAGTISAALASHSLPSPSPLSPTGNTYVPPPFQTGGSLSGPKPFAPMSPVAHPVAPMSAPIAPRVPHAAPAANHSVPMTEHAKEETQTRKQPSPEQILMPAVTSEMYIPVGDYKTSPKFNSIDLRVPIHVVKEKTNSPDQEVFQINASRSYETSPVEFDGSLRNSVIKFLDNGHFKQPPVTIQEVARSESKTKDKDTNEKREATKPNDITNNTNTNGKSVYGIADGHPVCIMCKKEIKRGPFITALGKIWCPDHFVCTTPNCRRPLQDMGFVEEQGQLYCEYCFEQYLAPSCSKCNTKIKGDCLNAIGKHFHPECFLCAYCGKLFGNSPFFLEDGLPYCEADWNELFTTKCFACGFPVEAGDRWVEALNNNYHSQCFNCTMCKKNLEGQSFFAKGGRPFCKNHAR